MPAEGWDACTAPTSFEAAFSALGPDHLAIAERLAGHLAQGVSMHWSSLGRFATMGRDRLDVERVVEAMHRAGWLALRLRRDPRGALRPNALRFTERGLAAAAARWPPAHGDSCDERLDRVVNTLLALVRDPSRLPPFPERSLVQRALGSTKALRLRDHRARLEIALGRPLEELILFHTDSVLTAGPVTFRSRSAQVDLRAFTPWACLPLPTIERARDLSADDAQQIICVENQTPFEHLCARGGAEESVLVFTAGYAGGAQRAWLIRLCRETALRRVLHWGDLDPHGLAIFRDLGRLLATEVPGVTLEPWQMEPRHLEREEAVPLDAEDREVLTRYLDDPDAPLCDTARAMLDLDRKLEQEALVG